MGGRLFHILLILVGTLLSDAYGYYTPCKSNDDCWDDTYECNVKTGDCERITCSAEKNCSTPLTECDPFNNVFEKMRGYCRYRRCDQYNHENKCPEIEHVACYYHYNVCYCEEGYRWNFDACVSVLGLPCSHDYNCDSYYNYGYNYICSSGTCTCNPNKFLQDDNGCQPYLGRQCDQPADCGGLSNTTCVDSVCSCSSGYLQRGYQCIWVLDIFCNSQSDCGGGNIICEPDSAVIGYAGKCRCQKGYALDSAESVTCGKVLDSFCSDIRHCGNASHFSFINSYLEPWWDWLQWSYFAHRAYYCNVDNICKCSPGYKRNVENECRPIYGSFCTSDNDCFGDSDSNKFAFRCFTYTCACSEIYYKDAVRDQWHEYDVWLEDPVPNEYVCKPLIGMKCLYGTVDNTQCVNDTRFIYNLPYDNDVADDAMVNVCVEDLKITGYALKVVVGQDCSTRDDICGLVDNAYCDTQKLCSCKEGFAQLTNKNFCEPVLGMNCTNDRMCSLIVAGTRCVSSTCACIDGYEEINHKCVTSLEKTDLCHQSISPLPDKYRRSPSYRLASTEPPIRDDLLEERWYDLGQHMLSPASSVTDTSPGTCGTKYPIYLKDEINDTEQVTLKMGVELGKTVYIGGLSHYGISNEFNVSIRHCFGRYFVRVKKAPVSFSGYCVDTGLLSNIGGNSSRKWAEVASNLDFNVVYNASTGTKMQIPYIYFQCHIFDFRIRDYHFIREGWYNGNFYRYYIDDGFYYTVNWYVAGAHCKSAGPYKRPHLNITDITEREIKEKCGQLQSGFSVQCSFEWSESIFGPRSTPIFSNTDFVGFKPLFVNSTFDGGFIDTGSNSPIGCKTEVGDTSLTCDIEWELIANGNCASPQSADDHPVCGFTAIGLTAEGLKKYGSWDIAFFHVYYNWTSEYLNGTSMNTEYERTLKLLVTQFESHSSDDVYKVKFSPSVSGHDFWNGYVIPDIEIKVVDPDEHISTVHVGWNTSYQGTIMTKTVAVSNRLKHSVAMPLYDTGEFLLLRSNSLSVEVQIKMGHTKKSTSSCLCAVTCRNGNEIYTIDICDSIKVEGFLMVHPNEDGLHSFAKDTKWWFYDAHISTTNVRLLNGIQVKVSINFGSSSLELTLSDSYTNEEFVAMDGLAAFQEKQYRLSNGSFMIEGSRFQNSWSVSSEDSLRNPSQHVAYAYSERFYQCDCPSSGEITNLTHLFSETYYRSWGTKVFKQITGAVRCSKSRPCSEEHSGLTWHGSQLQPIVQVKYAGDNIIMEQNSANVYGMYVLVLKDTFSHSGQECLLDKKIYCSVTVYEKGATASTNPAAYSNTLDIKDVPLLILSDICVIDDKCYNKNDTNGNDATFVCYPIVNPFEWTKDMSLIRQIGDGCIPSENHCSSINGSSYCNAKASKCACVNTHENVKGECIPKDCSTDARVCDPISYTKCSDDVCECVITAELNLRYGGCKPKVLGSECTFNDQCGRIRNAKCDLNHTETCVCSNQYDSTYGACTIKQLTSPCYADADCAHISNSSCLVSTSGEKVCTCNIGYKAFSTAECVLKEAFLTFSYDTRSSGKEQRMSTCVYEFQTGFVYTVSWIIDNVVAHTNSLKQATDKSFNSISVDDLFQEYLDTNPFDRCALDRAWKCSISTFYIDGPEAISTSYSADFKIVDLGYPYLYIPRGGEILFNFTVNLPLLCDDDEDCYLEFRLFDETDSYNCDDATVAVKSKQTCGNRFQGEKKGRSRRALHNSYQGSMRLTTKNNKKYKLREFFTLTMKIEAFGEVDSFWKKCTLGTNIHVEVNDQDRFWKNTLCYATNDPRLKTFDGQYYSMQQEGEFIMYRHKQFPVEVQIETELCNGDWASCTCGVSVRAGTDLFVVNHCHGDHLVAAVNTTDGVLDGVLRSSYSQEFYLPFGTAIKVDYVVSRWWSPMNVYIYPSPADMKNVEGLCGHFNGNWRDDFLHRNGAKTLSRSYYWRWWLLGGDPVDFSNSWKVSDDESMLNPDRIAKLSNWNEEEQYCVCPKTSDGDREPTCHRREADSCANIEETPGKDLGH